MSNQNWFVFGAIVIGIVVVIGVFFNPFDEEGPTEADVNAVCVTGGASAAGTIAQWKADGRLRAAAAVASALAFSQCADTLRSLAGAPPAAPTFTLDSLPPLEHRSVP